MDMVLDGAAAPEEEQILRFHLNGCPSCRRAMLLNRSISEKLAVLEEIEPPVNLLEEVSARIASGNYDRSPIKKHRAILSGWKVAAVIPFAAAALILFQSAGRGKEPSSLGEQQALSAEETVIYAPAPVMAYTRPSSVTTF